MHTNQRIIFHLTLLALLCLLCPSCNFFGNGGDSYTQLIFRGSVTDTAGNGIKGIAVQPIERYQLPDSVKCDTVNDPSGLAKIVVYTNDKGEFQLQDKVYSGSNFYYRLVAVDIDGEANGSYEMAVDTIPVYSPYASTGTLSYTDLLLVMKPKQ